MKKIFLILIVSVFSLFSSFAQETDNTYWYGTYEIEGSLLDYQFYKTQTQFDNCFFQFIKNNSLYKRKPDLLRDDYLAFGKTFIKNENLHPSLIRTMTKNEYLYSVTTFNDGEKTYVIINKRVGDKFYIAMWYRENWSLRI